MYATSISGKLITGHTALCLGVGIATSSCTGPTPQAHPAEVVPTAVSYDGRYEGTVQVTGASVGMNPRDCATTPRISIVVRNNQFSIALPHPQVAETTPTLRDRTTPVYNAAIQPDGIIMGISRDTNTTMDGRISGTRMSGQIYGLLCYYKFTADRV